MAYGFLFRDADGNETLRMVDGMPLLVHSERKAWDFNGTISVPNFDVNFGFFYVSFCMYKGIYGYGGSGWSPSGTYPGQTYLRQPEDRDLTEIGYLGPAGINYPRAEKILAIANHMVPTIAWDNATRIATITPAVTPAGWPNFNSGAGAMPDYYINFLQVQEVTLP
ncbi:MAG: hypothetical protein LCH92_01565 [Proteobacteria bacterium]|nr:hypothetical protein [Pseudomonadota bacterium]